VLLQVFAFNAILDMNYPPQGHACMLVKLQQMDQPSSNISLINLLQLAQLVHKAAKAVHS